VLCYSLSYRLPFLLFSFSSISRQHCPVFAARTSVLISLCLHLDKFLPLMMWFLFVETCLMVSTALMGNPPRQNSALKCRRKPWRRRERKRKRYFGAGRVLFVPAEQLDKCCRRKCDLVVPEHQQRWSNADVCCVSERCLAHQPRWTTRHASCFTDSSLLMAQVCCYNFQDLFPQHKWWLRSLFQHLRRFT